MWKPLDRGVHSQVALCYQSKAPGFGCFVWLNSSLGSSGCALIFTTKDWQQGGEDRGVSEGQQAGCCQVTTFKALGNLLFPGSTPRVCFLAACASVNELCTCTLISKLSYPNNWRPLITAKKKSVIKPNSLHQLLKPLPNNQHPNLPHNQCTAAWWWPLNSFL